MRTDAKPAAEARRSSAREDRRFGRGAAAFVLLLLAQGPSYGYDIRRQLEAFAFARATSDPGALYRLLRDLEADGSISSEWSTAGTGPARRYYRLTEQGRAELAAAAERMTRLKWRAERFLETFAALEGERQPAGAVGGRSK